jgi:hypothetical protein
MRERIEPAPTGAAERRLSRPGWLSPLGKNLGVAIATSLEELAYEAKTLSIRVVVRPLMMNSMEE